MAGSDGGAVPITLTPAQHFSARTPFDRNRALWGGFMLVVDGTRIFFAGDTAYAPFFRDIRQRLGPIDLALLPIGAYEPRWFMQSCSHESGGGGAGASRSRGLRRASACTSARSS